MKTVPINPNRAGIRPNSAGRMLSLFVTERKHHLVKCSCEFSSLVDRKFIAQQRGIIPSGKKKLHTTSNLYHSSRYGKKNPNQKRKSPTAAAVTSKPQLLRRISEKPNCPRSPQYNERTIACFFLPDIPIKANLCSILQAFKLTERFAGKKQVYTYCEQNRIGDHICYHGDLRKMREDYPGWEITKPLDLRNESLSACMLGKWLSSTLSFSGSRCMKRR